MNKAPGLTNIGAPGNKISEFGTVYGNFFSGNFGAV
jgi:hypothetical protein